MGRIVHLLQPLGARGDIFEPKFDYDNDDWNGGPAAMFFIWQDYGLLKKRDWGRQVQGFIQKGG